MALSLYGIAETLKGFGDTGLIGQKPVQVFLTDQGHLSASVQKHRDPSLIDGNGNNGQEGSVVEFNIFLE